ncbi:hypothetical protein CANMA_000632 [Candida margitis]|uniref:uncharacterized protein n=1 Tax=Candida margitis TaxID=1775924 RepID=UPI002225E89A|nr:uncharacterized protein CANMA_000632 [Candida margitis]KAI5970280.1 hypothetical protein CANMA_000632 [Candida margitis]
MITATLLILLITRLVISTPPACLLSCISEVSSKCERGWSSLSCVCNKEDQIVGCLIDICPFGNFNSARDHFLGTCLEHGKPTITNPYPPPAVWPPPDYEKSLPKMHEPVYRPEPTTSRVVNTVPGSVQKSIDHHNPFPRTAPNHEPIDESPNLHGPRRRPQHQVGEAPRENFPHTPTIHSPTPNPTPTPRHTPQFIPDFDSWFDEYDGLSDDSYDPERPLEWEEMDALDRHGRFIVVRRPINVPHQLRDPSNAGQIRRVVVRGQANRPKHNKNLIHESRRLVGNLDLDKGLPGSMNVKPTKIQSSMSVVVSHQERHSDIPPYSSMQIHELNHNHSTPINKLDQKRTKKTNRKTSPF